MKLHLQSVLIGLLIFTASCAGSEPSSQNQSSEPITDTEQLLGFQKEISTDYLKSHLMAFAHDSMRGRETGTPAEKKAANFLAEEYEQLGLAPVGDNGSYFQSFNLNASKSDSIVFKLYKKNDSTKVQVDRSVASSDQTANFAQLFGGTDTLKGQVVFAGFGVNDKEHDVAHLDGVDLKDKWVMVFQNTPNVVDGDTLINPKIDARARFQMIMRQGAEGILIIPAKEPREFDVIAQKMQGSFGEVGRMRLAYRDKSGSSSSGFSGGYNVINPALAAKLLGLNSVEEITGYRQKLVENITEFQPKELSYELTQIPYSSTETISSQNVLAFYEGADPELKDEVVVLTSHYDHVGIGEPDSTGDRIYNGADDDGSGTIGLLNIAKAFAEAERNGIKTKRSILFLNVSAEEKGLLGSRYYSDHPVFSMEKTVANLNTDMIGRVDSTHKSKGIEKYAYIIGAELISSDLDSLIKVANQESGQIKLNKRYNDLNDPQQFYRRSDHWHFGRKKVPFAFFFSGIHEDYHRPSDEVHKIRFEKMTSILRTMYATTVMIANADHAPAVDNQQFIEITKSDN
ncbi:M28 family peptidase [Fodinibius sp.]|uniref:M28 family peptidase n=1 Tax=Fodinibius sp. TaxID=1872440 RepID=UPI002ACE2D9E|nr:M28 family peptidase [Fodinibius sp.]MDZ7659081.1 M28 family peptidase [Fodinibius sp.]